VKRPAVIVICGDILCVGLPSTAVRPGAFIVWFRNHPTLLGEMKPLGGFLRTMLVT